MIIMGDRSVLGLSFWRYFAIKKLTDHLFRLNVLSLKQAIGSYVTSQIYDAEMNH